MKKGEMTTGMIMGIIVLVVSFAILLVAYVKFNVSDVADRETCHQSVILRASLPGQLGIKNLVPLKCKTDDICVTDNLVAKGDCGKLYTGKYDTTRVKTKTDIEKAIVTEMYDCWKMMGEGKVPVFSNALVEQQGWGEIDSFCTVCSLIQFDDGVLNNKDIELDDINLNEYIKTRAIPDTDISYYQYFLQEGGAAIKVDDKLPSQVIKETSTETGIVSFKSALNNDLLGKSYESRSYSENIPPLQILIDGQETGFYISPDGTGGKRIIYMQISSYPHPIGEIVSEGGGKGYLINLYPQSEKLIGSGRFNQLNLYSTYIDSEALQEIEVEDAQEGKSSDPLAIVFMQVTAPKVENVLENLFAETLGITYGASNVLPKGSFITTLTRAPKGGLTVGGTFFKGGRFLPKTFSFSKLRPSGTAKGGAALLAITGLGTVWNVLANRDASAGYCADLSIGDSARDGCSAVKVVSYDANTLKQFCTTIESVGS
jgi:hypothetical protein